MIREVFLGLKVPSCNLEWLFVLSLGAAKNQSAVLPFISCPQYSFFVGCCLTVIHLFSMY